MSDDDDGSVSPASDSKPDIAIARSDIMEPCGCYECRRPYFHYGRRSRYRISSSPRFRTGGFSDAALQEAREKRRQELFDAREAALMAARESCSPVEVEVSHSASLTVTPGCDPCEPKKRRSKTDKVGSYNKKTKES